MKRLILLMLLVSASPCFGEYDPCRAAEQTSQDINILLAQVAKSSPGVDRASSIRLVVTLQNDLQGYVRECRERAEELEMKLKREKN